MLPDLPVLASDRKGAPKRRHSAFFYKNAEKGEKSLAQTYAILSDIGSKIDGRGYPFYQFGFPSLFDTVAYTAVERHPYRHYGHIMELSQLARSLVFSFLILQAFHSRYYALMHHWKFSFH